MTRDDPQHCLHEVTEPVESAGRVVARLCLSCDTQLSPAWGCPDCDWEISEYRVLGSARPVVDHILVQPCQEHR